jgi:hypothetical protein
MDAEITKCPCCESDNICEDLDFPETMMCCDKCGADFMNDGEIILDPRKL